jgi:hypothetical protein
MFLRNQLAGVVGLAIHRAEKLAVTMRIELPKRVAVDPDGASR